MRLTLSHAVLLGLVAAIPFGHAYPQGLNGNERDKSLSLASFGVDTKLTGGLNAGEDVADIKRRHALGIIDPRVIPKLGDKPTPPSTGGKPGSGTPGGKPGGRPGDRPGDGPGPVPGTGAAPGFADGNLEKARSKGEKLNNDLKQAIFNNAEAPPPKKLSDLGYKLGSGPTKPYSGSPNFLNDLGIEATGMTWTWRKVWRDDKDGSSKASSGNPILLTKTDAQQHTIIVERSFNKENDQKNPKASWTDMVHSNWMTACLGPKDASKRAKPEELRYILRKNIVDIPTKDSSGIELSTPRAIDTAFDRLKADKTQVLKIDAKSSDADMKASYELLSAQTHVARVLQWLKDRHGDLGNKEIGKLHLATPEHYGNEYTIVIELV